MDFNFLNMKMISEICSLQKITPNLLCLAVTAKKKKKMLMQHFLYGRGVFDDVTGSIYLTSIFSKCTANNKNFFIISSV